MNLAGPSLDCNDSALRTSRFYTPKEGENNVRDSSRIGWRLLLDAEGNQWREAVPFGGLLVQAGRRERHQRREAGRARRPNLRPHLTRRQRASQLTLRGSFRSRDVQAEAEKIGLPLGGRLL